MRMFSSKRNTLVLFPIILLMIMISIFSCKKNEYSNIYTNLTVLPRSIRVGDTSGSMNIKVFGNGAWKAKVFDSTINWLSVKSKTSQSGNVTIADFEKNTGLARQAKITVSLNDLTDTITFNQEGNDYIHFKNDSVFIKSDSTDSLIEMTTTIPSNALTSTVEYLNGSGWVRFDSIEGNHLIFGVSKNSSFKRMAKFVVSFKDAIGDMIMDSVILVQQSLAGSLTQRSFSYVKNNLPPGVITDNSYIEGVIISDKDNPNMARNPNLTKKEIDKSVNKETVYIQSMNGQGGIKLVTNSVSDNNFTKNTIVKLWIKGLTLVKNTSPSFVVIKGVQLRNVIFSENNPNPLTPREVSIKDLTDNDIFTYVALKEVEISIPDGSFSNINEGYSSRADTYAMNIRGINGGDMYMLFNIDVPYRRNGAQVPDGSGTISGILVHEDLPRYGGDIGAYQIRPTERSDISLTNSRFSKALVKWTRFKTEYDSNPTATQNPMTPDIGAGTLTQSNAKSLNYTIADGVYKTSDYNGTSTTGKGAVTNGAWGSRRWWDNATNTGGAWVVHTSSAGISTQLSIQFDANTDFGGPRNFALEWSSDKTTWNKVDDFSLQDLVHYSNTLYTMIAGYKQFNFQLPIAASGLKDLYIRLVVVNNVSGSYSGPSSAVIKSTGVSRMGYFAISYNK